MCGTAVARSVAAMGASQPARPAPAPPFAQALQAHPRHHAGARHAAEPRDAAHAARRPHRVPGRGAHLPCEHDHPGRVLRRERGHPGAPRRVACASRATQTRARPGATSTATAFCHCSDALLPRATPLQVMLNGVVAALKAAGVVQGEQSRGMWSAVCSAAAVCGRLLLGSGPWRTRIVHSEC